MINSGNDIDVSVIRFRLCMSINVLDLLLGSPIGDELLFKLCERMEGSD